MLNGELTANKRATIGVTMGDAAGIGPEIIVKSVADPVLRECFRVIIVGDKAALERTIEMLGLSLKLVEYGKDTRNSEGDIEVVDLANLPIDIEFGMVSSATGKAAGEYIEKAVELWKDGSFDAITTAPINKRALSAGGFDYPGHTEFVAALTGTDEFAMSFFANDLRVVLLSTHLSLLDAIGKVTKNNVIRLVNFTDKSLSSLLSRKVRIAVAGLNPHASEGGMFGEEESREIEPAVRDCARSGIDVSGPYSPDTIFLRGYRGEFDAVIACYHDQATIAVKSLSFGAAVNVTLGLPLVRTSVDHGTAFDIAGKGIADESSLKAAINLAGELSLLRS